MLTNRGPPGWEALCHRFRFFFGGIDAVPLFISQALCCRQQHRKRNEDNLENLLFGHKCSSVSYGAINRIYLLVKCGQKLPSDEYIEEEFVRPDVLTYFQLSWFNYMIENLQGISGYYNHQEQLLCISRRHLNSDYVLLHEMIHLYEDVINELPLYYHDMLYWSLYQNLRKKTPGLDEATTLHAQLLNQAKTYIKGGLHDVIFLLKSFDLDIKQGYPLGTVLVYDGGQNAFKDLSYTK